MTRAWRKLVAAPLLSVFAFILPDACGTKKPPPAPDEQPPPEIAPAKAVPPVLGASPVSMFADAGALDGASPYEQARAYEAGGQYWLARLILEKKALGGGGTKEEIELLARLCHQQGDDACLDDCTKRLGKKPKLDAGASKPRPSL